MSDGDRVVVAAPAKINLFLHVGSRRADGYHDLESLVAFAAVGDVITIEPDDGLSLTVDGPFAAALGSGDDNLVMRAAGLLAAEAGASRGARIWLTKNLPVAAGLGGGSADAAAVLRALKRLWNLEMPPGELHKLAATLGADVPVCVESAPAWMEGKGERLTTLPPFPPLPMLLVNPGLPVPTGQVFAALRNRRGLGLPCPGTGFCDGPALLRFLRSTTNDLEEPARSVAPGVGDVLEAMAALPRALLARMSGSGATCFGIFQNDGELTESADLLAAHHPDWWIRRTTIASRSAPVPAFVQ